MRTYKALGALLEYPSGECVAALPEIEEVLAREGLLADTDIAALRPLLASFAGGDLLSLQEEYVDLFDRGRSTCLNLFEHVHGESRDRGQAMVDLRDMYHRAGLEIAAGQLPDYLPAMLEYLSMRPQQEAVEMLADCAHILQLIGGAVARRGGAHGAVFRCLLRLAGEQHPDKLLLDAAPEEDDSTPEALDRAWAEEPITFLGGCATAKPETRVVQFPKGAAP